MNFFKHYKDKPYKVHGVAKHSETMEELTVYETLYDNPTAKLWVRPRAMFEENVNINGAVVPRFKKIDLKIEEAVAVSAADLAILATLVKDVFGEWDPKWFHSKFDRQVKKYLQIAYLEGKPVGFKLGYELDQNTFYSWLGGVLPSYRRLGVASALIQAQHDWCKRQGYTSVETKTQNRFREQLVLSIKSGFDVIGHSESNEGGPKILLRKHLS